MARVFKIIYVVLILILISSPFVFLLPLMRMRLCVASNNPYRLQNQCVYCHNKKFQQTVRSCTGNLYLPANVSLEEGYCMVRQCRSQMPLMRPEPYFMNGPELGDAIGVNVDALSSGFGPNGPHGGYENDAAASYSRPSEYGAMRPALSESSYGTSVSTFNSPLPYPTKPRRRPPAQIFVGRPVRPIRPSLFG